VGPGDSTTTKRSYSHVACVLWRYGVPFDVLYEHANDYDYDYDYDYGYDYDYENF
jgi:hypothetical protein